jgi:hypothetical protein
MYNILQQIKDIGEAFDKATYTEFLKGVIAECEALINEPDTTINPEDVYL